MGEEQLRAFLAFRAGGIAALRLVDEAGLDAPALVGMGAAEDYADTLVRLARRFFRPTSHSRYQAEARSAAEANSHCIETLELIERTARRISNPTKRWEYTAELCAAQGDTATIAKKAARLRKDFIAPRVPEDGVRIQRDMKNDKFIIRLTGPTNRLQDVVTTFETPDERGKPIDAIDWIVNNRRIVQAPVAVHAIVTDKDIDHVLAGTDDSDDTEPVVVTNTGVRMTTSQLLQRRILPDGYITLAAEHLGPINTHRMRLASRVQRLALEVDSPTCCWPDCNAPISKCQAHHLTEYARGGETTPANMCWLCPHHNAVNGDPKRGRMTRINGRIAWVGPKYAAPRFTGRAYADTGAVIGGPAQGAPAGEPTYAGPSPPE